MLFTRLANKLPVEYIEPLWKKALWCDSVSYEYVVKVMIVAGLLESIYRSMYSYRESKSKAVHALTGITTSLTQLQIA